MKKSKVIIATVLMLTFLLGTIGLSGCATSKPSDTKSDVKQKTVGFILLYRRDQWYMDLEKVAIETAKERNINLLIQDADYDNAKEVQQIETFTSQKVDAIAYAPTDMNAQLPSTKAAKSAGIPVFVYDTGLADFTDTTTWVGFDNYKAGKDLGEAAAKFLIDNYGGKGKICIIDHPQNPFVLGKRVDGFLAVIKEKCPDAKVVAQQSGEAQRDKSMAIAENVLTSNPDTVVWLGVNPDTQYGIIAALESKNIDPSKVAVFGEGWGEETLNWLVGPKPYMKAAMVTPADKQSAYTINAIADFFEGKKIEKETLIPTDIVTKENAVEYFKKYGIELKK